MNHQINFQHLAILVTLALVFWLIWQLQCLSSDWAQAEILLKPTSPVSIHMLHEKVEGPEGIQSKGTKLWSLRGSLVKRGGEFSFARQVEKTPYTMKSVEREMKNGIGRSESSSRSVENAEMSKLNEIPREMEKVASFDELRISEKPKETTEVESHEKDTAPTYEDEFVIDRESLGQKPSTGSRLFRQDSDFSFWHD